MSHRGWTVVLMLSCAPAGALAGQVVTGVITDDSTHRPLADAEVMIQALGLKATTDASGHYVIRQVPPGVRLVQVRMVGYHPNGAMLRFAPGDTVTKDFTLTASAVQLPTVEVTAREARGLGVEGLEERKRMGFGKFYDAVELRRSEHLRLGDLLRRKGGVEVVATGRTTALAMNPHSRDPLTGRFDCAMQVYFNGAPVGRGGKLTTGGADPPDLNMFDIASLDAAEVYRSAAGVPGEYSGPTAECGVILLWMRKGP